MVIRTILGLSHTSGDDVTLFLTLRLWSNLILLTEICVDNICYILCNKVFCLFTLRCMSVWPGCSYVYHVHGVPAEARNGVGAPGTGVMDGLNHHVGAESPTQVLCKSIQ